jgi:hypothetical protein
MLLAIAAMRVFVPEIRAVGSFCYGFWMMNGFQIARASRSLWLEARKQRFFYPDGDDLE